MSESNLITYTREELRRAGYLGTDAPYGGLLGEAVMKMVQLFSDEGHSGMSASLAVAAFKEVAMYRPLTPLTGEDDEWVLPYEGSDVLQNKRCFHVFKNVETGAVYDSDGRIFREPSGRCFTNRDSRVPVTFPYMPRREYVDVPAAAE